MDQKSSHLSEIVEKHNRIANLQTVFVDVEKYSRRRTLNQISVIDALTGCMSEALGAVSRKYLDYAQANGANFQTDIVTLPTGDGAAIAFSFDGLHDIHLSFALSLLESAALLRSGEDCAKFEQEGWCNCHPYFNLRIGISEGKGILFSDLRNQFNVAGGAVNLAARAMGLADRNQIMFTEEAYGQIVDMVDDPHLVDRFVQFPEVEVKHDLRMTVYQYVDKSCSYLNSEPPELLTIRKKLESALGKLRSAGFPTVPPNLSRPAVGLLAEQLERMADLVEQTAAPGKPPLAIKAQQEQQPTNEGEDGSVSPTKGNAK